jgi:hypothetical protein
MTMAAHPARESDPFQMASKHFEDLVEWLRHAGPTDHGEQERAIQARGNEVLRLAYQAWFDTLSAAEKNAAARTPVPEGTQVRAHSREVESELGRLRFIRLGYTSAGKKTRFPLDEPLNLPKALYTHPLQERVARAGQGRAWDGVVKEVNERSSAHVPKRQAEQVAREAAKDFEAFYAERPANDALGATTLLAGSSDAKGVRMLPKALREATRKSAEAEKAAAVRGDPMAAKKPRSHDKRMAAVAAVWQQEPRQRTADDIVAELQRTPASKAAKPKLPRPENKRVWASVEKSVSTSVGEMFDEFDRRDPDRARTATVLIDGDEDQQTAIFDHARSHARSVTIVLDLIHVIHYIWIAGFALCRQKEVATAVWVARHLHLLLSVGVTDLVATIERATLARRLAKSARKPVERALNYFRRNADFMDYPAFLSAGLPIASGVIEGACRHLVQDRLGITGARWDLPGAEAMLKLRALHSSGDWDNYWRFHERQEALRNYPSTRAAA